jgi:hypothetical protein
MTKFANLDTGGSHPYPTPSVGQVVRSALIERSRTLVTGGGALAEKQDLNFLVQAWQQVGDQSAFTRGAIEYLLQQMREIASNSYMQPLYIQMRTTGQTVPAGQLLEVSHDDGWYVVDSFQPDYSRIVSGVAPVRMTVSKIAPGTPAALALRWQGGQLNSTYSISVAPVGLLAYPIGSTNQPSTAFTITGGEGVVPVSAFTFPINTFPNPAYFIRPGTVDALYTGLVKHFDTINTGSFAVPTSLGTFQNSNWLQVYAGNRRMVGDLIVTNGLILLLFQPGQSQLCSVYLWNTALGTPTWQLMGTLQYQDNAGNTGVLREVSIRRVGLFESQIQLTMSTSGPNWALFRIRMLAGHYETYIEAEPRTQTNATKLMLLWNTAAAYATGFTESASSTTFPSDLAVTANAGYSAAQGSAANSPIVGFTYQNIPIISPSVSAQGRLVSTTQFALGEINGPAQGTFNTYGFFAVPYSGTVVLATAQALVAPLYQHFMAQITPEYTMG